MAAHFDASGAPNGWMSKSTFFTFMFVVQFGTAGLLLGVGKMIYLLPDSLLSIPNKNYWLDESRRNKTLATQAAYAEWIAAISAIFFLGIMQLTIWANFSADSMLNLPWTVALLVVYLVLVLGMCLRMIFGYYSIPTSS
jgi:uncharacterized membrane protein